jgi:hypothetical protein
MSAGEKYACSLNTGDGDEAGALRDGVEKTFVLEMDNLPCARAGCGAGAAEKTGMSHRLVNFGAFP